MTVPLHPYLAVVADPFTRLARACYWQAIDPDFRHAAYWRDQVAQCQADYAASFVVHPTWSADVVERRCKLHREQCAIAIRTGYELANKRRELAVTVPDFESGSVCNTRTLSTGVHFSVVALPRTLSHG